MRWLGIHQLQQEDNLEKVNHTKKIYCTRYANPEHDHALLAIKVDFMDDPTTSNPKKKKRLIGFHEKQYIITEHFIVVTLDEKALTARQ